MESDSPTSSRLDSRSLSKTSIPEGAVSYAQSSKENSCFREEFNAFVWAAPRRATVPVNKVNGELLMPLE
jgi:hypothetical protein